MECKNCDTPQRTDFNYCPNCGAKVIRNRLTIKNLWYDVTERYFNLDNTFIKTFVHLFTHPHLVIESYISGVRRKYLNPISYLGIALTLSGLSLFLLRKFAFDRINFGEMGSGLNPETAKKIMTVSLDFNSFLFLLYIPVLAIAGWMLFNKRKYNLTEFAIVAIYSLAHFSIIGFFISVFMIAFFPDSYLSISYYIILLMALYSLYVLNKLNGRSIMKSFLYLLLFGVGFIGIGVLMNIVFLLTGILSFEDYIPQKP
ncbi:MAG: DUF3667 domain-containing protein [Eudoraea sp.]|nr:DUF3667 domain-containing protein [Eudoraea sp.]